MASLLVSTALAGAASADTIHFWTLEVQPERMAVQEEMAKKPEVASCHTVEIMPVEKSDIQTRATAVFAAGDLADVLDQGVQSLLPYAEAGILDTAATTEVVEDLGVDSFAQGPVRMAMSDGKIVWVPTDGLTQLVVYRSELSEAADLKVATSLTNITAAMEALHNLPEF